MLAGQFGRMLRRRAHETHGTKAWSKRRRRRRSTRSASPSAATKGRRAAKPCSSTCSRASSAPSRSCRLSTWGIRDGWWPFRNVSIGGRHIHHFVPGILIAFASGTAALLTDDDELEQRLAVPMGVGIGLTFDEAALLLDLRDVYWTRKGLLSVQLSLGATAILSIAILTGRMLRRGERRQEAEGLIPGGRPSRLGLVVLSSQTQPGNFERDQALRSRKSALVCLAQGRRGASAVGTP